MSDKNKKQFGIWMDSQHATVVGRKDVSEGEFEVLGHIKNEGAASNSNENKANNSERTLQHKFFKEITALMQNAEEVYVTGTGKEQEQFISYLAETPQFKNTSAKESTSNKMDDTKLVTYITNYYN